MAKGGGGTRSASASSASMSRRSESISQSKYNLDEKAVSRSIETIKRRSIREMYGGDVQFAYQEVNLPKYAIDNIPSTILNDKGIRKLVERRIELEESFTKEWFSGDKTRRDKWKNDESKVMNAMHNNKAMREYAEVFTPSMSAYERVTKAEAPGSVRQMSKSEMRSVTTDHLVEEIARRAYWHQKSKR